MKRDIPSIVGLVAVALSASAALASAAPAKAAGAKVTICHNTSSESNPVVIITVSENAVQTHLTQHGDVLFVNGRCGGGGGS